MNNFEVFDGITLTDTIVYGYQVVFIVVCWFVIGYAIDSMSKD